MIKNLVFLFSDRPLLCLALCCLLAFVLSKFRGQDSNSKPETRNSKQAIFIEIAEADSFPVVIGFNSTSELEGAFSSYDLPRELKNGDKVILHDNGAFTLSRIDGKKSLALGIPIGINSAGVGDLIVLPGIGDKLAQRIVEYRAMKNGYRSIDELIQVNGIGYKRLGVIKPFISLD